MISRQQQQASKQPDGSSGKPRTLKMAACFSESRPVEEHSKARVYGSPNLYYSSCRVLNVMRKCQPTGKIQFLTRFAIIRSSWGCTDVWRALMECQRKGQAMQILFVQPNQKSHKGNYPFAESVPPSPCLFFFFFLKFQALNVTDKDLQHDFSQDPSRAGPHTASAHQPRRRV